MFICPLLSGTGGFIDRLAEVAGVDRQVYIEKAAPFTLREGAAFRFLGLGGSASLADCFRYCIDLVFEANARAVAETGKTQPRNRCARNEFGTALAIDDVFVEFSFADRDRIAASINLVRAEHLAHISTSRPERRVDLSGCRWTMRWLG
jgi:hypothetical protein